MTIKVDIQYFSKLPDIPSKTKLQKWANIALNEYIDTGEVSIRIVDEDESKNLNEQWRKSSGPTNVLSFPYYDSGIQVELIGDIILCAPVIMREAHEQEKSIDAHWAHMVIHGSLHLAGHDHVKDQDAKKMESIEIKLLKQLGYSNPYK